MKKIVLFAVFAFLLSLPLHAETKIVLVDLTKIFSSYYKTKELQQRMQAEGNLAQKDLQDRYTDLQKMGDAIRDLINQANDKTLSEQARADKNDILNKKKQEYVLFQQQTQELQQNKTHQFQVEEADNVKRIVDEITKTVNDYAVSKSFDIVIDRSALSANGAPIMLYAAPTVLDITPDIITKLNATQPPPGATGIPPATGAAAPGSPSAPAPASGL